MKKARRIQRVYESKKDSSSFNCEEDIYKNRWWQRFLITLLIGGQIVVRLIQGKIHHRNVLEHLVTVGPGSLVSVLLIAFFTGMIFTVQTARELLRFGAMSAVGGVFALGFCRELAPVLTACVIAGQVGSAFAAEIGEMQVTEQIDALLMLKTDPIDYLVTPRVIACCIMLPILNILALVVGIIGGAFVAVNFYQLNPLIFLDSIRHFLDVRDLLSVVLKGVLFGAIVAVISCGWGLTTTGGAKGVSRSTTAAVITNWVILFMVDFFVSLVIYENLAIAPARGL